MVEGPEDDRGKTEKSAEEILLVDRDTQDVAVPGFAGVTGLGCHGQPGTDDRVQEPDLLADAVPAALRERGPRVR